MISDERLAEMLSGLDGLTPADCADTAEIDAMARELFALRASQKELTAKIAVLLDQIDYTEGN